MLLSYERNFGGTGMAGKVIAGTISTANDLNPTLKKQNWKLFTNSLFCPFNHQICLFTLKPSLLP